MELFMINFRYLAFIAGLTGLFMASNVQAQTAASCQADFNKIMTKRQAEINTLNAMSKKLKGKLDPIAACPHLRSLASVEGDMVNYMTSNKNWCSISEEVIKNATDGRNKTASVAKQALSQHLPDAAPQTMLLRLLPERFLGFVQLARIDRPVGWWLLLLPCWWSSALAATATGHLPNPLHLVLLMIGAIVMRGAGSTYNDIVDRDLDARVARTKQRPIPSGRVSPKQAAVFLVLQCLIGLGVLLAFNGFTIRLGFASLGFVLIYPFMKRITSWPQAVLGLAFAWGGLLGWAAFTGGLAWAPVCLYGAAIFWTMGYDTIYALQDIADDSIVGIKSTARFFGDNVRRGIGFLYGVALALAAIALFLAPAGWFGWLGLAAFAAHLGWQLTRIELDNTGLALMLFRSNRNAGLLLFAGLVLDACLRAVQIGFSAEARIAPTPIFQGGCRALAAVRFCFWAKRAKSAAFSLDQQRQIGELAPVGPAFRHLIQKVKAADLQIQISIRAKEMHGIAVIGAIHPAQHNFFGRNPSFAGLAGLNRILNRKTAGGHLGCGLGFGLPDEHKLYSAWGTHMKGLRILNIQAVQHIHDLVIEAGNIALRSFVPDAQTPAEIRYKNGTSPVTQADLDVNDFLHRQLQAAHPDMGWLSEETPDNSARLEQDSLFILDPIDGTRAFMSGHPCWTISLALVQHGQVMLAILHAPALQETFLAQRGKGASRNGMLLASTLAPARGGPTGARVAGPAAMAELCSASFEIKRQPKIPSLAYRLAAVAAGDIDLALAGPNAHDWDIAAADLILEEAGFCLTALDGRKPIYNKRETQHGALVAACEPLHKVALAALQSKLALPMTSHSTKQLPHLVFGGELTTVGGTEFKDLANVDLVGLYPDFASAQAVWKAKAQATVDNAHMRYFIKWGRSVWVREFIALLVTVYLWFVRITTRFTFEPANYFEHLESEGAVIATTWHGQHFMIHYARPKSRRFAVMISRSGDGDINARIARWLGIDLIRGSGGPAESMHRKGAVAASRSVLRALEEGTSVLMTADVPKIARKAGLGIITLAQHSGRPIYPIAVVSERRIDFNTWDKASFAKPFGRGVIILGAPVYVGANLGSDELESKRQQLELELNRIHCRAYAISGMWIGIYKLLTRMFGLVAKPFLFWRYRRGKENWARMAERRGYASQPRPEGHLAWLHGASVGESLSLLPLIERLQLAGFHVLLTTGTVTSAALANKRLPVGAIHQFLPLDVPRFVKRFLNHWQPDIVFFAESELWPNFISNIHRRNVPLVLVNARLSQRSFARWQKIPTLIAKLLSGIDLVLAQTADDAARLMQLGAARVLVTGNLKFDAPAPPANAEQLATLTGMIGTRPIWVAASTHPGEDELLVNVHSQLAQRFTNLLTIIVPRHPERGPDILRIVEQRKLRGALRSSGDMPTRDVQIYVADTMGELGLFYRLAGLIFMGGSLVPRGGQNPIEPAKLFSAIIYGPHVHNFSEVYQIFQDARGAVQVQNTDQLAEVLTTLLSDASKFRMMARASFDAVEQRAGATRNVMRAVEAYIIAARRLRKLGEKLSVPVICIGNFTVGGAGKTPTAVCLARALLAFGERPAVVSRGYGGALSGVVPVRVDVQIHTSADVGDEPLLLARVAPTYICTNRVAGARAAIAEGASLILLDDGLQNPGLAKTFSIAVVDSQIGVGNGLCLPAGPLRAPLKAQLPMVQALISIGDGTADAPLLAQAERQAISTFKARLLPDPALAAAISGQRVFAFAGIGRPEKFFETVRATGAEIVATQTFPDHHRFTKSDLTTLARLAKQRGIIPVTTEKDAMRLPPDMRNNVVLLPVTLEIDNMAAFSWFGPFNAKSF
eukprot:gene9588-9665_t